MVDTPEFPALIVVDGFIFPARDRGVMLELLSRTVARAEAQGIFSRMRIFDSGCRDFRIARIERSKPAGLFGWLSRRHDVIHLELTRRSGGASLEDVKTAMLGAIELEPSLWEASDVGALKNEIGVSNSFAELLALFPL